MNAERLLAHYEQIAEAPDAIAGLRRFIVDLAVRGKLVPQDVSDEPASELLKRIAKERADRVNKGELRKEKGIAAASSGSPLFSLPRHWAWSVADQLWDFENGDRSSNYPSRDQLVTTGIPFVNAGHLVEGRVSLADMNYITPAKFASLGGGKLRPGDQIYCLRGSLGKHAVFDLNRDAAIASSLVILRPVVADCVPYLSLYLDSDIAQTWLQLFDNGTAQPNLSSVSLRRYGIPVPPLAEQHRIVAKVNELMGLCDRLEAARAAREALRDGLAEASLARLNAPDLETFRADARFALDALPALTTRPDQIKSLRRTILNLAVRGKLVEGTTTKAASVGYYRTLQNGYAFQSSWFSKEGVRLLRNANIGHGEIRWNDLVRLPVDRLSEFERFQLNEGDIVLTLDRPFIVTGTKVARVSADDLPSLLLQRVGRFVETSPGLDDGYLFIWINSPHFNDQIDPGRSNGVPHISSKQVEAAEIFVPPLAEQRRIVAKVEALMVLCDRLEASLAATAATRRRLLEALLAQALAPADDRELEAAE